VARSISRDPYHNFRFGVRFEQGHPWLGFQEVTITPDKLKGGPGTIRFTKAYGPELDEFLSSDHTRLNIGLWHITEELGSADPASQMEFFGVQPKQSQMGPIRLDARGGMDEDHKTSVLLVEIKMRYQRMVMSPMGVEQRRQPRPRVRAQATVIM